MQFVCHTPQIALVCIESPVGSGDGRGLETDLGLKISFEFLMVDSYLCKSQRKYWTIYQKVKVVIYQPIKQSDANNIIQNVSKQLLKNVYCTTYFEIPSCLSNNLSSKLTFNFKRLLKKMKLKKTPAVTLLIELSFGLAKMYSLHQTTKHNVKHTLQMSYLHMLF